ncbi:MAG: helix-turn-helix transcriptional regulator [Anaerolineae bacterium]|jgi:transcriptional regulator with XRE-family HTH domain|nr:helix-turn-helix transcriptional regulator [Anaerolineae bacterium]MBT6321209.1 helix-turn-helix transcriptional regulator [Anaerolineae bacterium]MBT6814297.1 helix-turn-helix transcriptional regulator [Anaerolineae bacterium]MBT7773760.1 helix-turn-helix transcriptional regulator [Anaerolineae bacterium]
MNVGKQLRIRRKEMGLSLRELGKKAGVTAGFLSQVENDQVSPSLNSLQKIATALQVPMFYFLNNTQGGKVVKADQRRKLYFQNSQIGYDLLTPDFTRKMMAFVIRMEPHAKRVALPLAKPTEQWMYVQEGKLKISIGEETHLLEKGDTIYYDGDLLNEFCSDSDEELMILCCITPPAL